jgi:hypothetical protein
MPTQEQYVNTGLAASLSAFQEAQNMFIHDLRSGTAKVRHRNRLWPILAAHHVELLRIAVDDTGSIEYYEALRAVYWMLVISMEWHIKRLEGLRRRGKHPTLDEKRTTHFLNEAFDTIHLGLKDLGSRFPKTPLKEKLPKLIAHLFPDLTPAQVERDVESIRQFVRAAVAEKEKVQEQNAA